MTGGVFGVKQKEVAIMSCPGVCTIQHARSLISRKVTQLICLYLVLNFFSAAWPKRRWIAGLSQFQYLLGPRKITLAELWNIKACYTSMDFILVSPTHPDVPRLHPYSSPRFRRLKILHLELHKPKRQGERMWAHIMVIKTKLQDLENCETVKGRAVRFACW